MDTALRSLLAFLIGLLVIVALVLWFTGKSSEELISTLIIGMIIISSFYFCISILMRLPFLKLRQALAGILAITFVMIGLLYFLPDLNRVREISLERAIHEITFYNMDLGHLIVPIILIILGFGIGALLAKGEES